MNLEQKSQKLNKLISDMR
ncbi:MAG: hypothetical protein ACK2U3_04330, partial [Anaerolineales bacterium]